MIYYYLFGTLKNQNFTIIVSHRSLINYMVAIFFICDNHVNYYQRSNPHSTVAVYYTREQQERY